MTLASESSHLVSNSYGIAAVIAVALVVILFVIFKIVRYIFLSQSSSSTTRRTTSSTKVKDKEMTSALDDWSEREDGRSLDTKWHNNQSILEGLNIMKNDQNVDDENSTCSSLAPSPPRYRSRSRSKSISRILTRSSISGNAWGESNGGGESFMEVSNTDKRSTVLRWNDDLQQDDITDNNSLVSMPSSPSRTLPCCSLAIHFNDNDNDNESDNGDDHSISLSAVSLTNSRTILMDLPQRQYELDLRAQIAESLRSISGKSPHPLHFCVASPSDSKETVNTTSSGIEGSSEGDQVDSRPDDRSFTSIDL